MTLSELAIAALLSLNSDPIEHDRLSSFGRDIAHVVSERDEIASWIAPAVDRLPSSPEHTVLALVAVAHHESGLRADVADCRVTGDVGQAFTAFQLRGGWAFGGSSTRSLCRSPRLAAHRALAVLSRHGRCGEERAFWGYASGRCTQSSPAARRQIAIWRRLIARFLP